MPNSVEQKQQKKPQPPEIILAVDVLARVQQDNTDLANDWRKKLPALALRLAKSGQEAQADQLEQIVRENWDDAKIETLFRAAATEIIRPIKLTYKSVIAAFPKTERKAAPPEIPPINQAVIDALENSIATGTEFPLKQDGALHMAAQAGRLDLVKYLLEKDGTKADIHANNDIALRKAAECGHLEVVKYLLEKDGEKANIHARGDDALRWPPNRGIWIL